ncbi:MAG: FAD-dependent oxidoreductase [Hyphomicrobiales bacterium]|nr:FAD-dependent oxidoreductase [Hyphomicrobiales bacterium]
MAEILKPDICVIGAGSGGLSVAAVAAAFGVSCVLIEKGRMGGDCLNYGCVPSKALLASAKRAAALRKADPFGIAAVEPEIDFARVNDHVQAVVAAIAPNDSEERFTGLGVRVFRAAASFKDARSVVAGDHEIHARRFVVAAGSSPMVPPIPGLDKVAYLTNETIFDNRQAPDHLIIIGGGPIGMEMAQAHRRLGSAVTVVEMFAPLAKDDPEAAAIVLDRLAAEGVNIRANAKVAEVSGREGAIKVTVEAEGGRREEVAGTHLLVAAGRKPNIDGLGLDKAGIAFGRAGITVDKALRTSNRRVYAIGDVAGGLQFTHVANYHAGLVIRSALFRLPAKENRVIIPWVTFTDPELAQVGLSEAAAKETQADIRVLRWPYEENDRAQTERVTEGFIKVVTTRRGKILGATIVGANAGEIIQPWALAISQGLNIKAMTGYVAPYPTLGEISKRAAISFYTPSLTNPWLRRIIALLRLFG